MSFYNTIEKYRNIDIEAIAHEVTEDDVLSVLQKSTLDEEDFMKLLSPAAGNQLEAMAIKSREESLKHFGKAIVMYTPMYISNYCMNQCAYCGFNYENKISRKKLNYEEIEAEAKAIAKTGLKHILLLTGESPKVTPIEYLREAVKILRKYFDSVVIEIFPMTEAEYGEMIEAGVDGLAVYQETYNEAVYDKVHISGPKKDYRYRLDAPERAGEKGMRSISVGALLGITDWKKEVFLTGLHGKYLVDKYSDVEYSFSFPRIKSHVGMESEYQGIDDKTFVQIMLALKIFLPYFGTNITTRETYGFRKNLIPLGVTKMSAGVSTEVGGHTNEDSDSDNAQFNISDHSSVEDVKAMIKECGYQAVQKDWMEIR